MKKRMWRLGLALIGISLFVINVQAQSGNTIQTIEMLDVAIPSSPQAAQLAKYGNHEINMYKGLPEINIPVYVLKLKELNIPISLSYDPSGVKVDQIATPVGLNWTLNAGGQITSIVHGLNDEEVNLHSLVETNINDLETFDPNQWDIGDPTTGSDWDDYDFAKESTYDLGAGIADVKNLQPDIFIYNHPNGGGRFIMDNGFTFGKEFPYSNVAITYNSTDKFTLKDTKGNIYKYKTLENSWSVGRNCTSTMQENIPFGSDYVAQHSKTWKLTEIETVNGETILFTYTNNSNAYFDYVSQIIETKYEFTSGDPLTCPDLENNPYTCTRENHVQPQLISSIEHVESKRKIEFNYAYDRSDFANAGRLTSIKVYVDTQEIKSFNLGHNYSSSRLMLDSFTESGKPSHTFNYNTATLPARMSFSQDYFGYANYVSNNTLVYKGTGASTGYADRSISSTRVKAASLEKITYPTGGSTVINMESKSKAEGGGLRVASIYDLDGHGNTVGEKHFTYTSHSWGGENNVDAYGVNLTSGTGGGGTQPDIHPKGSTQILNADCKYDRYTNSSVPNFINIGGADYGNELVTVDYQSGGVSGRTVTKFSKNVNDIRLSGTSAYNYDEDWGAVLWGQGEILEQSDYKYDSGTSTFKLVQKKVFTYEPLLTNTTDIYDSETKAKESYVYGMHITHLSNESSTYAAKFDVKKYKLVSAWYRPNKTVIYTYDPEDETKYVVNETSYEYNNTLARISAITEKNSNNDTRKTEYVYAIEDVNLYPFITKPDKYYSVTIKNESSQIVDKSYAIWSNTTPDNTWQMKELRKSTTLSSAYHTSSNSRVVQDITYGDYGNPTSILDASGNETKYFYGDATNSFTNSITGINGASGIYLTGIQKIKGTVDSTPYTGDDLFSEVEYDSYGRVISVTDENEQTSTFEYDSFNRLIKGINPVGGVTKNSYFYSSEPSGIYSASAPNMVETVTGTDSYETDFSISDQSEWTRVGDITFGYSYAGETTVRMGVTGSAWSYIYKNTGTENLWAKIDMYPDNTTQNPTGSHNYALSFNDGTGGSDYRCAIKYDAVADEFLAFYRTNSSASWSSDYEFSAIDAAPNAWYTIEMEKRGSLCMMWVYKKGASRSSGEYFEVDGFPEGWTPQIRIWSKDDFYYLANFEYIVNPQTSISYLDGLGREIQSQVRGANKVITTETLYDERGLPEIAARPVEINPDDSPGYYSSGLLGGTGFTPGLEVPALAPVHTYYATLLTINNDEDYAYSQTEYEDSPLARVEKSTLPGIDYKLTSGKEEITTYSVNKEATEIFNTPAVSGVIGAKSWAANTLTKTISEDPSGNKTITYTNAWRQVIASGIDMDATGTGVDNLSRSSDDLVTEYAYDARGNLVLVEDPRGLLTKYWYNNLGQLIKKELPDQDEPNSYCYDDKGRLRFHRDPNHEANVTYYYSTPQYDYNYIKYDDLDRPVETGVKEGLGSYVSACASYTNNQTYPSSYHTPKVYYSYDGTDAYTGANNLNGRLTKVKYLESLGYMGVKVWGETWYSYNDLGLVEWIVQKVPGVTGDIKITYTYDELGRQTEMGYNVTNSSDDHYFWYEYDALGRLEYVYSDTDSNPSGRIKEAEYTNYSADGQVAQMKLGNGNIQTVDYTYTAQGWLDKMNAGTVSSSTNGDRFALDLDYADNGNVETQKWMQSAISTSNTVQYDYTYDKANRLSFANFSGAGYSSTKFDVNPTYDDNGNISYMERYGDPTYSELEIGIKSTSNRIEEVIDYDAQQIHTVTYDANGNMLQNRFTNGEYDERNLMTSVKSGTTTIQFGYDADGNRVRKEVVGGIETTYVRGANGQTIAVYENGSRAFVNLLAGGQMLGTYDGSQRRYFLKDHLGTVRTTVDQSGNVDGYDDYYPFGLVMSGRSNNTSNPDDNYKFTGHELDEEAGLGLIHMNARTMDPVIGRFMQIDPLLEYSSPYTYVGNNPLSFTDPTGMASCGSNYVANCGSDGEIYATKRDAEAAGDCPECRKVLGWAFSWLERPWNDKGQQVEQKTKQVKKEVKKEVEEATEAVVKEGPEALDVVVDGATKAVVVIGTGAVVAAASPVPVDDIGIATGVTIASFTAAASDATATTLSVIDANFYGGSLEEANFRLNLTLLSLSSAYAFSIAYGTGLRQTMLNEYKQSALIKTAATTTTIIGTTPTREKK